MISRRAAIAGLAALWAASSLKAARAQFGGGSAGPDPRVILAQVINALQNGGPPQVYSWFGPQLFQTVHAQTGGSGIYPPLRQLGPVVGMHVTGQQPFPAGPVYAVQVQHQGGVTNWFIGISQLTSRIEYLNFEISGTGPGPTAPPPDVSRGPQPNPTPGGGGGTPPQPTPGGSDGCRLFPSMC